jgi:hypothetical protein
MTMEWVPFDREKLANQPLPTPKRYLLLQVAARPDEGLPAVVAVGWMRFAAGDLDCPTFTIPGVGGAVVAWSDCLGDEFEAPLWPGTAGGVQQGRTSRATTHQIPQ